MIWADMSISTWWNTKSETFEKFKEFQSEVENHRNKNKSFYDMIVEVKYLSYEFGLQLKNVK